MGGMRKLRWAMDCSGFWELDMETPATIEGTVRPAPSLPLPLGLSRGVRLSRPKQLDFMHRFMASPLVPSYTPAHGLALDHVQTFHLHNNWTASLMEKFHLRKFLGAMKDSEGKGLKGFSWVKNVAKKLVDACSIGIGSEFLVTPDALLLLETYRDDDHKKPDRTKAVFNHKFLHHNLTIEAAWPGLFVDDDGTYWDVPSFMAIDLASNASDSGLSYHLCGQHNSGHANNHVSGEASEAPTGLLPGFCAKAAISFRKTVDIWKKEDGKVKMVQPYDIFLSVPHFSVTGIIGSVVSASLGDHLMTFPAEDGIQPFILVSLRAKEYNASFLADLFGSVSFTMQHGNFQRLLFDLSRLNIRLDFPSGATSLKGFGNLAYDLYNSRNLNMDAVNAICPKATLSFQQQIAGPFSFRAESRLAFDLNNWGNYASVDDTIFAIEYAMQVLGSARATAWYSTKNQEAMVELRFFES